jgi:hypothetical protein
MTTRATQLVYEAAGRPAPRKPVVSVGPGGTCYWCAGALGSQACRQSVVCGETFTDHDVAAAPESPWVCVACTWSMTGRPPDTLRLWSVLWIEADPFLSPLPPSHPSAPALGPLVHLQNKADLSAFDEVLRRPPRTRWVASVADSGKLHVFPHAVVNSGPGPWRVRFERDDVLVDPGEYGRLADAVAEALAAGFYKSELLAVEPQPSRIARIGIESWRRYESAVARYRGGAVLDLAVFLSRSPQKEKPANER